MLGSLLLHATVAVALLVSWNFSRDLKVGSVVPVTIVSREPSPEPAPAEQAPIEQQAQTDQPTPEAPLQPTPPAPEPKPAPPPPKPAPPPPKPVPPPPTPKPVPKAEPPPKPIPTPKAQAPAKPEKSLDLDALSASISSLSKPAKPSSAPKGPTQAQTAPVARQTLGTAASAAAMSGLSDELTRRWNPNCDVEGGRDVQVQVAFTIGQGGQVVGDVTPQIKSAPTPVARTAAERAVSAVYAAAPFRNLPHDFYGQKITVHFNAREACS
ncbi:energy transducer TonB [Phenylobacterium sp.]|uniref:energy transducer TonB n=1 Tax=Phenylobacterium sp. TaxID=1871053 RepID=UPI001213CE03|nr:energy transducer TonB [Phenylobacterium sp.]THD58635.1 MAG: energy transducer TonB [Phenylobacterium sp.]